MFSFYLHCREHSWTWTSYSFPWPVARKYENSSLQIYLVYLAGPVLVVFVLLTRLQFPPFLKDIIQSKVNIYASFRNYRNQCNFPVVVSQDRCYVELQMLLSHCPISVSNRLLCVNAWLQFKKQVLGGKATWPPFLWCWFDRTKKCRLRNVKNLLVKRVAGSRKKKKKKTRVDQTCNDLSTLFRASMTPCVNYGCDFQWAFPMALVCKSSFWERKTLMYKQLVAHVLQGRVILQPRSCNTVEHKCSDRFTFFSVVCKDS